MWKMRLTEVMQIKRRKGWNSAKFNWHQSQRFPPPPYEAILEPEPTDGYKVLIPSMTTTPFSYFLFLRLFPNSPEPLDFLNAPNRCGGKRRKWWWKQGSGIICNLMLASSGHLPFFPHYLLTQTLTKLVLPSHLRLLPPLVSCIPSPV